MRFILLGVTASFFFAVTFVLNRNMSLDGGYWMWSAALRYLLMLPLLFGIVLFRRDLGQLFCVMKQHPWKWVTWGSIGFGLFYAPLCFSSAYGPAWLIAGTWQVTIVIGVLLTPLHMEMGQFTRGGGVPHRELTVSSIILLGIVLMEWAQASSVPVSEFLLGSVPVLIAAIAYPLGNRKTMQFCAGQLDVYQRLLGMTIGSMPFWFIMSFVAFLHSGLPGKAQMVQSCIVAISSGIVATILFFKATDMARHSPRQLAAVEATQSGEVVFSLLGEFLMVPKSQPSILAFVGIAIVVLGLIVHSLSVGTTGADVHKLLSK